MASPARRAPQQQRSQKTVEQIIEAADVVFGEVGLDRATTVMIAKRASVSVGSLYHFFPDKRAIARAVIDRYFAATSQDLEAAVAEVQTLEDAPKVVGRILRVAAARQRQHPGYYALSAMDSPGREGSLTRPVRVMILNRCVDVLRQIGSPLSDEQAELTVNFVTESMRHFLYVAPQEDPERARYLDELERMLVSYFRDRLGLERSSD